MSTPSGEQVSEHPRERRGVRLVPGGLEVGGAFVPLIAGSVHYWRLDPAEWRACLIATKALGARLIDVYVPWNVHELAPGKLELGRNDPQRDVAAFLRLCHELGLLAILRPGPHINAELTHFGIPERILWDPACQARSAGGNPVMLPMVPFAFPVPSYASEAFLDETTRFFHLLAPAVTPLLYPEGPIVLVQVDNEGALYFRDGAYDQDYHPDAIRMYRAYLRGKYRTIEALQAVYGRKAGKESAAVTSDEGAAPGKASSPPPPPSWICPSSARRRATLRISFCSFSTSDKRTGPFDSRSSRNISAARCDMFLNTFSRSSGEAPLSVTIRASD